MASSDDRTSPRAGLAIIPHTAPKDHNQAVADPIAHFKAIPWCAALLADPSVLHVVVPDRRPLATGESNFVRRTMNSPTTIRASVTFFRPVLSSHSGSNSSPDDDEKKKKKKQEEKAVSASAALLAGGGAQNGEDPRNPFLLLSALADLGADCMSFAGTMHGGLFPLLMDEVMGTAANFQAPHGAYTVTFTTDYRRAVQLPQVVLIRGRVTKKEGRKIYTRGTIEDKDGNIMCEGHGIWLAMSKNVGRSQL
ncbi:HotDog domain-containing protein [Xylariaceae sp. FL1651]|nr:HotDog domain-containing protein [Xylariaceae sp. FL1651]